MCCRSWYKFHWVLVLLVFMLLGAEAPAQELRAEVDNILFIYDATSSMHDLYKNQKVQKAVLARKAMLGINRDIPGDLELKSGIYAVVPFFKAYQRIRTYEKKGFKSAIENLPMPERQVGPQTALAKGLIRLEPVLQGLSGNTALILFSDGGENKGGEPVAVLEEMYQKFDLCFHFVSYAGSGMEKEVIKGMSKIKNCSRVITSEAIQDQQSRKDFVRDFLFVNPKDSERDAVSSSRNESSRESKGEVEDKSDNSRIQKRINLDIKFDYNQARVKPKYREELKRVAETLKKHPDMDVLVQGHTDRKGTVEYNKKLSQKRAASVKKCLVEKYDVSSKRIATKGYGESEPLADNNTPEGRRKNRRVELVWPKMQQGK